MSHRSVCYVDDESVAVNLPNAIEIVPAPELNATVDFRVGSLNLRVETSVYPGNFPAVCAVGDGESLLLECYRSGVVAQVNAHTGEITRTFHDVRVKKILAIDAAAGVLVTGGSMLRMWTWPSASLITSAYESVSCIRLLQGGKTLVAGSGYASADSFVFRDVATGVEVCEPVELPGKCCTEFEVMSGTTHEDAVLFIVDWRGNRFCKWSRGELREIKHAWLDLFWPVAVARCGRDTDHVLIRHGPRSTRVTRVAFRDFVDGDLLTATGKPVKDDEPYFYKRFGIVTSNQCRDTDVVPLTKIGTVYVVMRTVSAYNGPDLLVGVFSSHVRARRAAVLYKQHAAAHDVFEHQAYATVSLTDDVTVKAMPVVGQPGSRMPDDVFIASWFYDGMGQSGWHIHAIVPDRACLRAAFDNCLKTRLFDIDDTDARVFAFSVPVDKLFTTY
jgi:hypothetical protein